jgi:hypothetical protein
MSKQKRSRGAPRPSFAPRTAKNSGPDPVGRPPAVVPAPSRSRPADKKSGRRNADRRVNLPSASADAAARPDLFPLPGVREGREGRARLSAFHRGACGSEPTPPLSSSTRSWDAACFRRYLKRACPGPASFSQADHGAGRAFSRSRPGTAVTSRRPREPHSPRPPASPGRPSCKLSEIRDVRIRNRDECQ